MTASISWETQRVHIIQSDTIKSNDNMKTVFVRKQKLFYDLSILLLRATGALKSLQLFISLFTPTVQIKESETGSEQENQPVQRAESKENDKLSKCQV